MNEKSLGRSRATLADVAARAGVSTTTASFALSGRTDMRIADDTQRHVRQIAEELDYRPNRIATSLRTHSTKTIGLVSNTVATSGLTGAMISGVIDAARRRDHQVLITETGHLPQTADPAVTDLLDRQVDGLIYASMFTQQLRVPPIDSTVPLVLLNCFAHGALSVLPDERQAGRDAAQLLIDTGTAQRVHVLGGTHRDAHNPQGVWAGRERMAGITELLSVHEIHECAWHTPEIGFTTLRPVLARSTPDAVLCLNDRLAFGAYQALEDAGLRIPADVRVVSFDDSSLASWLRPRLSSISLPHYDMGMQAVQLLLDPSNTPHPVLIPMPVRVRGSLVANSTDT